MVRTLFPEADALSFMRCTESDYKRRPVIVTRSGYTGEIGYELFTFQDIAEDLWRDLAETARSYREKLAEAAAETDDDLLAKYLEEGSIGEAEMLAALKKAVLGGTIVPVLAASATRSIGFCCSRPKRRVRC